MDKRIPFFLYASANDMRQTPITYVSDGVGGLTEPFKDRLLVWSDGSKEWLENLIYHEFTHEAQFGVLVDGFWKSARILKTYIYPLWMMEGMAEYETGTRDIAVEEMYMRDMTLDGKIISLLHMHNFAHLKPHQTTLAYKESAQVIRFLAEQYGKDKPAEMLELYRDRYDVNNVLKNLIGTDLFGFDRKFREYSEMKYKIQAKDEKLKDPSFYGEKVTETRENIPEFNTSGHMGGDIFAYITTKRGHPPHVEILNVRTGEKKDLNPLDLGLENIPYGRFSKALRSLSVSSDGKLVAFSGQKNHREYLCLYDTEKDELRKIRVEGLMEIRQPSFSPSGEKIVFVGMKGGFNDLYELELEKAVSRKSLNLGEVKKITDGAADVSSPYYAPDRKTVFYSCEVNRDGKFERDICETTSSGETRKAVEMPGNQYDPVVSPDGEKLIFTSDSDGIFELYEKDVGSGKIYRLTRSIGGNFTPYFSPGGEYVYFSAFRHGSVNVYRGETAAFPREKTVFARAAGRPEEARIRVSSGTFKKTEFKASTDLFYPAFVFSSPGGLFWWNYLQASDMMGYHNLSFMMTYNSGSDYLNYSLGYAFKRFRTSFFAQFDGYNREGLTDELDLEYDEDDSRQVFGFSYPFDRHNAFQMAGIIQNERDNYENANYETEVKTRVLRFAFTRDTLNGLYLTATSGSLNHLVYDKAFDKWGGNEKYDAYSAESVKYFPLSKRSAVAARFYGSFSTGRNNLNFDFRGIGGVRGFQRGLDKNETSGIVYGNLELRTPLFGDLNYYMWYMFPDFYFKALDLKFFVDSGYGFDNKREFKSFSAGDLRTSAGFGFNLHTYMLQTFQMVLSLDCAVRTSDGGTIFYFYIGPLF